MNDPTGHAKSDLRSEMKAKLAAMSAEDRHDRSVAACDRLVNLEVFQHALVVMLYMPLVNEVDVTPIALRCFRQSKTVCVPRVDWKRRDMVPIEVSSFDDDVMDTDDRGIRTPREGRLIVPNTIDMVIAPGLAFDTQGHRLGRGGGFYDRFLGRLRRSASAAGIAFDLQIVDHVPANDRDATVGLVVTERRVTRIGRSRSHR